jgi:hypothetical protein
MEDSKNLFQAQYEKNIKNLFKNFLYILEELKSDHDRNFGKLVESLPSEYLNLLKQADYFDDDQMFFLRKKVLDLGNNSLRSQNQDLEKFIVEFKFN